MKLRCLFGESITVGKHFYYRKCFSLITINGGKVVIGESVFFNTGCSVNCCISIEIGNNVMFGENVHLYDHDHKYALSNKNFAEQGYVMKPIVIGNNCWIATNVVILKGVKIGNNVVIGANCIVNTDIPDNSVVVNESTLTIKPNTKKYSTTAYYDV